jgi:hypothetical protein
MMLVMMTACTQMITTIASRRFAEADALLALGAM